MESETSSTWFVAISRRKPVPGSLEIALSKMLLQLSDDLLEIVLLEC